jgi:hypothetical protein
MWREGENMPKRPTEFVVTHSYAPDPDLRKVEAALELWQGGLAERLIAQGRSGDSPLARLHLSLGPRIRGRKAIRKIENR